MNLRSAQRSAADRRQQEPKRRCREQVTLVCIGLRAALRRRSRRQRLRANLLAALADRLGRE